MEKIIVHFHLVHHLLPHRSSIIPDNRPSLDAMPTATATAAVIQAARVPSFVSRPLADGRTGNIKRTTNSTDGSLSVKVTSTTYQPNGYREMTTEYFHIPSHMAATVSMAMDAVGEPPSSVYRTNIQHQILPPSSGAVISPPTLASAYPITTPGQSRANDSAHQLASSTEGTNSAPTSTPAESVNTVCRNVFGVILVIGIIGAGIGAVARGSSDSSQTSVHILGLHHIHEEVFGPFFKIKPTYGLHQNKPNFDQPTALGMSNEAYLGMFDTWNELY